MQIKDVTYTHELVPPYEDRLNDFLALGWCIVETKKTRECSGPPEAFVDQVTYILGTDKKAVFPEGYDAGMN